MSRDHRPGPQQSSWGVIAPILRPYRVLFVSGALLMAVSRLCGLVAPASIKYLIDAFLKNGFVSNIWLPTLAIAAALAIDVTASRYGSRQLASATNAFTADLRTVLMQRVLALPMKYFEESRLGALVSSIISDTEGVRLIVGENTAARILRVFEAVVGTLYLLYLSPSLTAISLVCIVCGVLIPAYGCRAVLPISREHRRLVTAFSAFSTDLINGVRTIKSHVIEDWESKLYKKASQEVSDAAIQLRDRVVVTYAQGAFVLGLTVPLVTFLGIRAVVNHQLSVGAFAAFTAVLWRVLWPFMDLISIGTDVTAGLASLERVASLLREEPELRETPQSVKPPSFSGHFVGENISFAYSQRPVLHDLSFEILPGQVTALVGRSGSGKSTLMALLAGLYSPTIGSLRIDRHDLSTLDLAHYRKRIAYVNQHPFMFGGSIRDNLIIANPEASKEDILRACRMAGIDLFLEELEGGLDASLGEQGIKLSGGQRQRIAIARAILSNPDVLLLDEATAHLDIESDALIQQSLVQLMQGRTTVIIAHRLSTISHAQQILVLDDGRIAERGNHESLLRINGHYTHMYQVERHGDDEFHRAMAQITR